ncbi:MAG: ABC transporter substrate-binding protein [Candidatus Binatia bacterium]
MTTKSAVISLIVTLLASQAGLAATPEDIAVYRGKDRQSRIEEGAKREGELGWYTTLSGEDSAKVIQLFEKRYPFVKIKLIRLTSERLVQRYMTEFQAGRFLADVVETADFQIEALRRKGTLRPYYTPSVEKYDKRFVQSQGFWVANRVTMIVLGYNTRLVPPAVAPRKYEDLLDPKWKGQMSVEREQTEWFMSLMDHWGEEKGKAFFQRLGAQNPSIRSGHTLMAQLVMAGEDPMSPNSYSQYFPRAQKSGAPVDWINLEPVIGKGIVSALAKNSPHPHAAMLFLDFFFSKEGGEKIIHEVNRIASHPELVPDPPRMREGFDFIMIDPVKYMDRIDRYAQLWREWVLGGR